MLNVQRYVGLHTLPPSYSCIFEQASEQSFFLSLPWFQNFERTIVSRNETVLIYGVEERGRTNRPLGALVLRCQRQNGRLFSPKKLEGLSNYYTSYFGPVLSRDCRDISEVSRSLASALWSDRGLWNVLNLRPLDQTSPVYTFLIESFKKAGMVVQTYFCFGNWYLKVGRQSYAEYFKSLPTVLRKNIPYMTRKLERTHRVRTEIVTSGEGLKKALADYERIYLASWRDPEPYPDFIRGLARTAMVQGWLRLGLTYLDDEPAAAQLWIVHAGVASIYKVCYEERFSKLSVGTILTAHLMQHVIDTDRVREVDYLTGDDAYKKDWMSHRRERWGIIAFNPYSLQGRMQAIRHVRGRAVKRMFMKVPQGLIKLATSRDKRSL
jgi:Acetyltransferase (GNAT) domain